MSAAEPGALASAMLAASVAGRADPARFGRGRSYVRDGAVIDLSVAPGELIGSVLGSRSSPYQVSVRVPRLPDLDTDGDGTAVGVLNHLVPQPRDLRSDCSCPDDADPCKHAVAVLLAFAQQVAIHPRLLATWRSGGERSTTGGGGRNGASADRLHACRRVGGASPRDLRPDGGPVVAVGTVGTADRPNRAGRRCRRRLPRSSAMPSRAPGAARPRTAAARCGRGRHRGCGGRRGRRAGAHPDHVLRPVASLSHFGSAFVHVSDPSARADRG